MPWMICTGSRRTATANKKQPYDQSKFSRLPSDLCFWILSRVAFFCANSRNARKAILGTKQPITGSYQSALLRSQQMLADLRRDPYGVETLQQDLVWLEKLDGRKKMVKAPANRPNQR